MFVSDSIAADSGSSMGTVVCRRPRAEGFSSLEPMLTLAGRTLMLAERDRVSVFSSRSIIDGREPSRDGLEDAGDLGVRSGAW